MNGRTPQHPLSHRLVVAAALAVLSWGAGARQLPNVDALEDLPVPAAKAARQDARVSRMHLEPRLGVPSFVWLQPGAVAKSAAGLGAEKAARQVLGEIGDLYGLRAGEADALAVKTVERLGGGGHLVRFQGRIDGIEVFRESAAVVFDASMRPVAVGGLVGPTLSAKRLAKSAAQPFTLTSAQAIAAALGDYGFAPEVHAELVPAALTKAITPSVGAGYEHWALPRDRLSPDGARMNETARAKRVWFRLPEGLVPAWYVELQMAETRLPGLDYYAYVIAADDGRLLFRNNQSAHAAFTYRVYAETTGANLPLPSPVGRGATPHPTGVNDGFVPPFVASNLVTLQNGPISTNDPWLPAGATRTSGNNVEAYANRFDSGDNQPGGDGLDVDPQECNLAAAPTADFRACTTSTGVFDHTYDTNAEPLANRTQGAAAVTNLFYMVNWLHDWFYDAGFKEADGNAQFDNYGRGGVGGDSIRAHAQDNESLNNANMSTPADGARPRMRMYVFQGRPILSLTATPGGSYAAGTASFGPQLFSVTAPLILAADGSGTATDACTPLVNNVVGRIVLVDRGTCSFVVKALNVQAAGGLAMIVANNVAGQTPPGLGGVDPSITIGSLSVTQDTGLAMKAALGAGAVTVAMTKSKELDRDGALENGIVAHEWGHYISNRLIADANGLGPSHARGLGEGWADFHSLLMMLKEGDPLDGVYAVGGYAADGAAIAGTAVPNTAHYAGFRRYPYSRNLAKNPLTFRHIANENALPASPAPARPNGNPNAQVHNTGEIWASMLWQCYTALAGDTGRLTFAQAQDRMKRYLVAGYKLTPPSPTLLEARDAILAAMAAEDAADLALCAQAFAQRGAGAGAVAPDRFSTTNNGVVESFTAGGELKVEAIAFEPRSAQFCDADGALDNGETAHVAVTVRNIGTSTMAGGSLSMSSTTIGVTFPVSSHVIPTLAPFAETTIRTPVTLSGALVAGAASLFATASHASQTTASSASLEIPIQLDRTPNASATDDAESETSLWGVTLVGAQVEALKWVRGGTVSSGRYYRAPTGSGAAVTWLTSPPLVVAAPGIVTLTISHRHDFEFGGTVWDGGVIEVSFNDGATWTDLETLVPGIYNGTITDTSGNPLANRRAFAGQSAGYPAFNTVAFPIPATAGTMRVRFGAATDTATSGAGWDVDDIAFAGIANTPFELGGPHAGACALMNAVAGTPQVAAVGTQFGTPLKVLVSTPTGAPVAGATVSFSAPPSAATGTFSGGASTATAVTDSSGFATAPAFTANGNAGTYAVVANVGQAPPVTFVLTNGGLHPLTVSKAGYGQGIVNADAPGISCGGDCAETYPAGAAITLTAAADAGSVFEGWSGACSGTGTCQVSINGAKAVTATFGLEPALDTDNDGIPNGVEIAEGRNPLVRDNDVFSPGAGAARLFAMQQYRDFLGREGDPAGIQGWVDLLEGGGYTRAQVIDAFVNSPEFGGFVAPVVRLYFATFLRVPDYAGLVGNTALVRNGTVTLTQLADFFVASPEFAATYGSLDNTQFVTLLYNNVLGRAPDPDGLNGWVALLAGGTSRGQVLLGFSESPEYQAAMANEVLVTMMYTAMLRRSPEPAGFSGWVGFLDAGTYTRAQVIDGFFQSAEYRNRFLPPACGPAQGAAKGC